MVFVARPVPAPKADCRTLIRGTLFKDVAVSGAEAGGSAEQVVGVSTKEGAVAHKDVLSTVFKA